MIKKIPPLLYPTVLSKLSFNQNLNELNLLKDNKVSNMLTLFFLSDREILSILSLPRPIG